MGHDLAEALNRAQALRNEGRHDAAIESLRRPAETYPDCWTVHEILGNLYADKGESPVAERHFRECLRIDENHHRAYYNLGCLLRDSGQVQAARECFHKALVLNPGHANSMVNLAELTNDDQEALRYLKQATAIQPGDADIEKATSMWSSLSSLSPTELIAQRLFWATQACEAEDLRYARIHLELAREGEHLLGDQEMALLLAIESNVLRAGNAVEDSVETLEKAVVLDPTVAFYWNNLAARRLLKAENRPPDQARAGLEQAVKDARKAIAMKGQEYARPHQNLAAVYMKLFEVTGDRSYLEGTDEPAQKALDLATRQLQVGPAGPLVCPGCSTHGKLPAACRECVDKARSLLRDADLASGDYSIS